MIYSESHFSVKVKTQLQGHDELFIHREQQQQQAATPAVLQRAFLYDEAEILGSLVGVGGICSYTRRRLVLAGRGLARLLHTYVLGSWVYWRAGCGRKDKANVGAGSLSNSAWETEAKRSRGRGVVPSFNGVFQARSKFSFAFLG